MVETDIGIFLKIIPVKINEAETAIGPAIQFPISIETKLKIIPFYRTSTIGSSNKSSCQQRSKFH
eukprot:snap_masked-scaffold_24-processed-gene-3.25-mRNA-1 protein AED:1.00 eAED:1.00 QI:0/0/0/0/1/1/2/0/64